MIIILKYTYNNLFQRQMETKTDKVLNKNDYLIHKHKRVYILGSRVLLTVLHERSTLINYLLTWK